MSRSAHPDGKQLIRPLEHASGNQRRIRRSPTPSGGAKLALLRSLAELWPFTSGTLTRPCRPNETMFLSQLPYVPLGDLRPGI